MDIRINGEKAINSLISNSKIGDSYAFKDYCLKLNIIREKYICLTLWFLNIYLLIFDINNHRIMGKTDALKYLLYLRVFALIFCSIYLYVFYYILNKDRNKGILKAAHYSFITIILVWSIALVTNAQYIHGQISAYIISIFSLTTLIYLTHLERISFILGSYIFFLFGLYFVNDHTTVFQLQGHIVNSLFLIVVTFYVSMFVYNQLLENYINTEKITEHSKTIEKLNNDLEKIIRKRTRALMQKHKKLLEEMKKRHETEIEFTKAQHFFNEERLEFVRTIEQEKIRTMFLANLSHELRTPLNIIFAAQQMVDKSLEGDINKEKLSKYSRMIKQNSYRLIRLIGNLIDITKIDSGHYKLKKANVDIVKLIEDIYYSFVEYVSSRNIKVLFNSELTSLIISCDPDLIERIVLNLLANAVKFIGSEGIISINIREEKLKVVIEVKDNGIGIPEDLKEAIFERFIQVDKTITRNHEGSGIGLSLVKSFVEMHGGRVYVESSLGEGSTFFVELPTNQTSRKENTYTKYNIISDRIEKINIEFSDIYYK